LNATLDVESVVEGMVLNNSDSISYGVRESIEPAGINSLETSPETKLIPALAGNSPETKVMDSYLRMDNKYTQTRRVLTMF